jgi:hypothetical protein
MNAERQELLVSKFVGGEADEREWKELVAEAEHQPRLWRDMAEAHHDQTVLARAIERATGAADHIAPGRGDHGSIETLPAALPRLRPLSAWSGWAAAALLMLAWAIGLPSRRPVHEGAGIGAAGVPVLSAAEAFDQYMTEGRRTGLVIGEVPTRMLVESRPSPAGNGIEVIYVRQVLERATVPDLYRFAAQDERGQPALVRMDRSPRGPM